MNGRVYDPELGRFLSADPHVQSPRASQSYNRYSYVLNNPIRYADPSGYFFEELGEFFQTDLGKVVGIGLAIWGGFAAYQAASSAAMMGASGACLAPWAPSVVFAGTVAGGAAMGAINGAVAGVSQTGTFEGFLTGAAKGGALGAAGGALGAWFGPGTAGRMFGGGLNGAFMTGDIEGFGRGMLSGLVPADLGIDAFYSNAWANTGINILRDGIRGAIIDGSDGARRSINAGLFNNAVGHLYGFIASGGKGFLGFRDGAFRYKVENIPGAAAITFGNVISYNGSFLDANDPSALYMTWLRNHEREHINIQSALGVTYLPAHAVSQWIGGGFFDITPLEYAPYMPSYPYDTAPPIR